MSTVASIQYQAAQNSSAVYDLHVGQAAVFGTCGCARCGHDLIVAPIAPGQAAGRITAFSDHWRLDNLSRTNVLYVKDMERKGDQISVPPGRGAVMVSFELAQVFAGQARPALLMTVFGPEPDTKWEPANPCPMVPSEPSEPLDRGTIYFAVLVALCQNRLRGDADAPLPTSSAIAATLTRQGRHTTARAVDANIEYLLGRLGLRRGNHHLPRRSWRKEALATAAIQRGIVTLDDCLAAMAHHSPQPS
jgi:hypothetical protein